MVKSLLAMPNSSLSAKILWPPLALWHNVLLAMETGMFGHDPPIILLSIACDNAALSCKGPGRE